MKHDDIIRKIESCLRLAQSSNPHEAAAALRQAQKLMQRHGISEDQLKVSETLRKLAQQSRNPRYQVVLINLVCDAFGVDHFVGRGRVGFVGIAPRDELAGYAWDVLWRQLQADRKQYIKRLSRRMKPHNKRLHGDTFALAWVRAVRGKVDDFAMSIEERELTTRELRRRHPGLVATDTPLPKGMNRRHTGSYIDGHDAGKAAHLRHAMNPGHQPAQIGVSNENSA